MNEARTKRESVEISQTKTLDTDMAKQIGAQIVNQTIRINKEQKVDEATN